ncbi:MAG: PspC domain-containing protein, partial [Deltaproteobacteria bacterium]|nr:PspC domain-containing protein [Deltaproteobacteria bacterium]
MSRLERIFRNGLYRSRSGAILGVCRGIAEYFDFSVFWTRAITIVLLFFSGFWPVMG